MSKLSEYSTGKLIGTYVKVRDKIKAEEMALKERMGPFQQLRAEIEAEIMTRSVAEGVDSFKSELGTAYISSRSDASVADRDALLEYVRENDLWHLLKISANPAGVREYMEETKEAVPGVNFSVTKTVGFRKPTKKASK